MTGTANAALRGGGGGDTPEDELGGVGEQDGGVGAADRMAIAAQLGRSPRAMRAVAHRCPCGLPDVVETSPRLPDGTPFPTLYYLTCPRACTAVGRVEASGRMRVMAERLGSDPDLALRYRRAHEAYLGRRRELGEVPEIDGISAGGMPGRVKCLHALLAHSLAAGPGVNPLGDEVRDEVSPWWSRGPCVRTPAPPGSAAPPDPLPDPLPDPPLDPPPLSRAGPGEPARPAEPEGARRSEPGERRA
jgi:hypothetical protein